jgi:hypothetical protein
MVTVVPKQPGSLVCSATAPGTVLANAFPLTAGQSIELGLAFKYRRSLLLTGGRRYGFRNSYTDDRIADAGLHCTVDDFQYGLDRTEFIADAFGYYECCAIANGSCDTCEH